MTNIRTIQHPNTQSDRRSPLSERPTLAVGLLAAVLRFFQLGLRPLSEAEAVQALAAFRFTEGAASAAPAGTIPALFTRQRRRLYAAGRQRRHRPLLPVAGRRHPGAAALRAAAPAGTGRGAGGVAAAGRLALGRLLVAQPGRRDPGRGLRAGAGRGPDQLPRHAPARLALPGGGRRWAWGCAPDRPFTPCC